MRCLLLLPFCFLYALSWAQSQGQFMKESNQLMSDGFGRPLYMKTTYLSEGSPYWDERYRPARVTIGGTQVPHMRIRINLQTGTLLYSSHDTDMVFIKPVSRVEFYDSLQQGYTTTFARGFPAIGSLTGETWYQMLDTGRW